MQQRNHKQGEMYLLHSTPCTPAERSQHCELASHGSGSYCTGGGGGMAAAAAGACRSPVWADLQGAAQHLMCERKWLEGGLLTLSKGGQEAFTSVDDTPRSKLDSHEPSPVQPTRPHRVRSRLRLRLRPLPAARSLSLSLSRSSYRRLPPPSRSLSRLSRSLRSLLRLLLRGRLLPRSSRSRSYRLLPPSRSLPRASRSPPRPRSSRWLQHTVRRQADDESHSGTRHRGNRYQDSSSKEWAVPQKAPPLHIGQLGAQAKPGGLACLPAVVAAGTRQLEQPYLPR